MVDRCVTRRATRRRQSIEPPLSCELRRVDDLRRGARLPLATPPAGDCHVLPGGAAAPKDVPRGTFPERLHRKGSQQKRTADERECRRSSDEALGRVRTAMARWSARSNARQALPAFCTSRSPRRRWWLASAAGATFHSHPLARGNMFHVQHSSPGSGRIPRQPWIPRWTPPSDTLGRRRATLCAMGPGNRSTWNIQAAVPAPHAIWGPSRSLHGSRLWARVCSHPVPRPRHTPRGRCTSGPPPIRPSVPRSRVCGR